MSEQKKEQCPRCHSDLTIEITNARRCQQCGEIFALVKDPISAAAQERRNTGFQGGWRRSKNT